MRPGTPGFVGGRLREGREARGLTATSLADLLGVSKQAVSRYESGELTPAPEVMRKIGGALNLSIHFFLRPESPPDPSVTFFRSMSSP
jgi:transcriptional regulator with XRE-family HTH domain